MRRHLLVSGGPGHDFDRTSAAIVDALTDLDVTTTIVADPAAAVAALEESSHGGEPWDLLTVNALRWRMEQERYAEERDRWALTLAPHEAATIERHVAGGGGLLALHTAVICFDDEPLWRHLIGAGWNWDRSGHRPAGPVEVAPTLYGRHHPATERTRPFTVFDELYLDVDLDIDVVPLLTGTQDGRTQPVLWARQHGHGRVVTSLLGHGPESLTHPRHRALLASIAEWASRTPSTTTGGPT